MKKKSQKDIVWELLLERGPEGATAHEFIYKHGITRSAAIVHLLRKAGHDIRTRIDKAGFTARYIYVPPAETRQTVIWEE